MNLPKSENSCPRTELAAYIDGELSAREELELELHLASCKLCAAEINQQKRLLQALDFALEGEREFKLPENFTRVVVANAESKVSGLRSAKERFNAVFVIAALFLVFLLGIGSEIKSVAAAFVHFGEQFLTVAAFTAHLIYNVAVGASILLRSFGAHLVYNSSGATGFAFIFFAASLFALSRFINRSNQS